jgi:C1A family cysteine protease
MNIGFLLAFDTQDHTTNTGQLNLAGLQARYGTSIAGTNMYWGLQDANLDLPAGQGLQTEASQFITDFVSALPPGGIGVIDFALEPNSTLVGAEAFADVNARLAKIGDLGTDLATHQTAATNAGKTLRLVVRFASEMNLGSGNLWAGAPDDFRQAWVNVRQALANPQLTFLMNFAPFIYAGATISGNDPAAVTQYWPGDDQVDIVGCTWYAGNGADIPGAKNLLDAYFNAFAGKNLSYAVSELGGSCNKATGLRNTEAVQSMFWHLRNFRSDQTLDHVTFFLEQPWSGAGVDLGIVQTPPTASDPCAETSIIAPLAQRQTNPVRAATRVLRAKSLGLGWKPSLPDARDMRRSASLSTIQNLPPSVDLRPNCPPILDQGRIGSCTSNALSAAVQFDRMKAGDAPPFVPSRLFIYYNGRQLEGTIPTDSGLSVRDGIKVLSTYGDCPENLWPYNDTPADPITKQFPVGSPEVTQPPQQCFDAAANYKIVLYEAVPQDVMQMKAALADGFPFTVGFTVYASWYNVEPVPTIITLPTANDSVIAGHAVLVVGYDDTTQLFTVQNSWGVDVGDAGYFYMPYAYLTDSNLSSDFWTIHTTAA